MPLRSKEDMNGFPANKASTQDIKFIVNQLSNWCDNYRGFVNHIFCEQTTMEEKVTKLFWCVKQIAETQLDVTDSFKELYEWVANFFENLDVQDEVNRKIDELVESGALNEMFAKYVPYLTPEQFGAVGDGTTDDVAAFNEAMEQAVTLGMKLNCHGKYHFGSEIVFKGNITGGYYVTDNTIYVNVDTKISDMVIESNAAYVLSLDSDKFPGNRGQEPSKIKINNIEINNREDNINNPTGICISSGHNYSEGVNGYHVSGVQISNVQMNGKFAYAIRYMLYHDFDDCWINDIYLENIWCMSCMTFIDYWVSNFRDAAFGGHTYVNCRSQYKAGLSTMFANFRHCRGISFFNTYAWDYEDWFRNSYEHQIINIATEDVYVSFYGINDMYNPVREIKFSYTELNYESDVEKHRQLVNKHFGELQSNGYATTYPEAKMSSMPTSFVSTESILTNVDVVPVHLSGTIDGIYGGPMSGFQLNINDVNVQLLFKQDGRIVVRTRDSAKSAWKRSRLLCPVNNFSGTGYVCTHASRPDEDLLPGVCLLETDTHKPIWWYDGKWYYADGTQA